MVDLICLQDNLDYPQLKKKKTFRNIRGKPPKKKEIKKI